MFGATGDLARRKLLPGLLHLSCSKLAPEMRVIGTSLDELDTQDVPRRWRTRPARSSPTTPFPMNSSEQFIANLTFVPQQQGPEALASAVAEQVEALGGEARLLHYLSVPPKAVMAVMDTLHKADLAANSRVIMEKPFGVDLASARELNKAIHERFDEEQIFRIDHFLGKEAAQNILAFRFANGLFEPIWNRSFIDHIQIDVPERLTVEGRAQFYESVGAFKDMVVTHLFQILAFVAMEPPTELASAAISDEKNKVFRSMRPLDPSNGGARAVPGLPRRARGVSGIGHRDVRRAQMRDRQLALGGCPVLSAHRQGPGRRAAHHLDRVPRAAAEHVPARIRCGTEGSGSPDVRSRRRVQDVAVVLRQAARTRG